MNLKYSEITLSFIPCTVGDKLTILLMISFYFVFNAIFKCDSVSVLLLICIKLPEERYKINAEC